MFNNLSKFKSTLVHEDPGQQNISFYEINHRTRNIKSITYIIIRLTLVSTSASFRVV